MSLVTPIYTRIHCTPLVQNREHNIYTHRFCSGRPDISMAVHEFMLPEMAVAHEFFEPPPEEKAKLCSDEPAVHNWRDCKLRHESSGYGENWHESKMFALVAPHSLSPGDGSSSSTGTPVPLLWLDSGAAIHVVGDAKILTNLRDPPTKMAVTVADGSQLPITKVGVIQAPNINISDVYLAPGLEMNLISVRQLAKSKIVTTFYENYAELCIKGKRIGGAIADNDVSLYRLCFFKPHA